jgi:hypothetical protein
VEINDLSTRSGGMSCRVLRLNEGLWPYPLPTPDKQKREERCRDNIVSRSITLVRCELLLSVVSCWI